MGPTVRECMNTQLVYLRAGDRPRLALQPILEFGITAVPVLDDDERPVGVVSLRDLVDPRRRDALVTEAVATVGADEPIAAGARKLAEAGVHHLVVVDADGRAAGMLSALDVVRALVGMKAPHPPAIDSFGRRHAGADADRPRAT
jgi:CBS-domain-containing membrane protein